MRKKELKKKTKQKLQVARPALFFQSQSNPSDVNE